MKNRKNRSRNRKATINDFRMCKDDRKPQPVEATLDGEQLHVGEYAQALGIAEIISVYSLKYMCYALNLEPPVNLDKIAEDLEYTVFEGDNTKDESPEEYSALVPFKEKVAKQYKTDIVDKLDATFGLSDLDNAKGLENINTEWPQTANNRAIAKQMQYQTLIMYQESRLTGKMFGHEIPSLLTLVIAVTEQVLQSNMCIHQDYQKFISNVHKAINKEK